LTRVAAVRRRTGGAAAPPPAAASTTAPLFTGAFLDDDALLESVLDDAVVRPLAAAKAVSAAGDAEARLRRRDASLVADLATSGTAAARVHLAAGDEAAAVTAASASGLVAEVAALPAGPLPVGRRLGEVGRGVGSVNDRHENTCLRPVVHKLAGSTAGASRRQTASPPASPTAMSDGEGGSADADDCAADGKRGGGSDSDNSDDGADSDGGEDEATRAAARRVVTTALALAAAAEAVGHPRRLAGAGAAAWPLPRWRSNALAAAAATVLVSRLGAAADGLSTAASDREAGREGEGGSATSSRARAGLTAAD